MSTQRDPSKDASPSPWSLMERSAEWLVTDCRGNTGGYAVAAVPKYEDCTLERVEANARLIAAAPDLLDACKAALGLMVDLEKSNAIHINQPGRLCADQIRAAIAKAEGKN